MAAPAPALHLVAPGNAQHQGRRDSQQDSFGFSDFTNSVFIGHGGYLAVLADGMGGMENGAFAAIQGVRMVRDAYQGKTTAEAPTDALERAVRRANSAVYEEARRLQLVDRMGATVVAAALVGDRLHWVHAGDSRLYLFEHGELSQLTVDHNYGEKLREQVARGEITAADAREHPLRNTLTAYLGRPEPMELSRCPAPRRISPGAWVMMCSDGLSGVLQASEMAAELHGDPQAACQRLVNAALARGLRNQDNTTVLVMHLPTAASTAPDIGSLSRNPTPTRLASRRSQGRWHLLLGMLVGLALVALVISLMLYLQDSKPEPELIHEVPPTPTSDGASTGATVPPPKALQLPEPPVGLGRASPAPPLATPAALPPVGPSTRTPKPEKPKANSAAKDAAVAVPLSQPGAEPVAAPRVPPAPVEPSPAVSTAAPASVPASSLKTGPLAPP